jgi:hypothetical protein
MVIARWAGQGSDDNALMQQQIGNLLGRGSKGVIEVLFDTTLSPNSF